MTYARFIAGDIQQCWRRCFCCFCARPHTHMLPHGDCTQYAMQQICVYITTNHATPQSAHFQQSRLHYKYLHLHRDNCQQHDAAGTKPKAGVWHRNIWRQATIGTVTATGVTCVCVVKPRVGVAFVAQASSLQHSEQYECINTTPVR